MVEFKRGERVRVGDDCGFVNKLYPYGRAHNLYEVAFDNGGLRQVTASAMVLLSERKDAKDEVATASCGLLFEDTEKEKGVGFTGLMDS